MAGFPIIELGNPAKAGFPSNLHPLVPRFVVSYAGGFAIKCTRRTFRFSLADSGPVFRSSGLRKSQGSHRLTPDRKSLLFNSNLSSSDCAEKLAWTRTTVLKYWLKL